MTYITPGKFDNDPEAQQIISWLSELIPGQRFGSMGFLDSAIYHIQYMWRKIEEQKATDFQKLVWKYLCCIPSGQVRTYKKIAIDIKHPRSFRAVANACGKNPLYPEVPCHRAIRSNGHIGGYSGIGGIKRKTSLLNDEGFDVIDNLVVIRKQ